MQDANNKLCFQAPLQVWVQAAVGAATLVVELSGGQGNYVALKVLYVVSYVYDADGRMTELTNARGYKTSYEYDKVHNLTCTTDALDGKASRTYDANGRLTSETNALGDTTSYVYNKEGWVTAITDPRGGVTKTEYDPNGNVTKITDAESYSIAYTYDALNRMTSYMDQEGYRNEFSERRGAFCASPLSS